MFIRAVEDGGAGRMRGRESSAHTIAPFMIEPNTRMHEPATAAV